MKKIALIAMLLLLTGCPKETEVTAQVVSVGLCQQNGWCRIKVDNGDVIWSKYTIVGGSVIYMRTE